MNQTGLTPYWGKKNKDESVKIVRVARRNSRSSNGSHIPGGTWKLAYADFMTAMMAFFLAMWLGSLDSGFIQGIRAYFTDPAAFRRSLKAGSIFVTNDSTLSFGDLPIGQPPARRTADMRQLEELMSRIRHRVLETGFPGKFEGRIEVVLTESGLRIELVETGKGDTYFAVGSATPAPAIRTALEVIGTEIAAVGNQIVVEGHTDARSYSGNGEYSNWELSVERANVARRILEKVGVDPKRIREVRGYADRQPRVSTDPYAPENRRVSILLLPARSSASR